MSMENSNDTIGNRTRDLPTCGAVPQPTALPRTPERNDENIKTICILMHNDFLTSDSLLEYDFFLRLPSCTYLL